MVQSCPEASPVKWHQAHTTWFFETFVLRPFLTDCEPFREEFRWLFNSYYNSLGEEIPEKKLRASFSRPSLDEVLAFRAHVDEAIERFLAGHNDQEASRRITLGLNHEQQHQELALTDIKHAFFSNPLHPAYRAAPGAVERELPAVRLRWHSFDEGLAEIGYTLDATNPVDFCFDNETPRHKVYLEPFQIANRIVTCREYLDFIADGAYSRPEFWLSEGWDTVRQLGWRAPLYWERDSGDETGWRVFTLSGWRSLLALLDTPVCHVSQSGFLCVTDRPVERISLSHIPHTPIHPPIPAQNALPHVPPDSGAVQSIVRTPDAIKEFGGARRNRTADKGFADLCLATWLPRLI